MICERIHDHGTPIRLTQITDTHIFDDAHGKLSNINTRKSLAGVLALLHADPDAPEIIVASGDLAHESGADSYRYLIRQLAPFNVPTFWMPGNHDYEAFMRAGLDNGRPLIKQVFIGNWQILLLDTHEDGQVSGVIELRELEFLEQALKQHPEKHTIIFTHHHVLPIGCAWLDLQRVANAEVLLAIVDAAPQVRVLACGHVHQEWHAARKHYMLYATPSTCMQFKTQSNIYAEENLPPGYRSFALYSDGRHTTVVKRVATDAHLA